jgi:hypothetical protein
MRKLLLIAIIPIITGLQGCALLAWNAIKPVEVQKKAVERTPLNLADPQPLKPSSPNWIIITPANAEQVWAELKKKNADLVLFALTDDGYEELAVDMAQIRTFIAQQREVIVKYREYYEPRKPVEAKEK